MTTRCSMSQFSTVIPPCIHHNRGCRLSHAWAPFCCQRTRSSKSIFQTFSTALILFEISMEDFETQYFHRQLLCASSKRSNTYRNFNENSMPLSICIRCMTLKIFLASPITPLHFAPIFRQCHLFLAIGSLIGARSTIAPNAHSSPKAFSSHSQLPPIPFMVDCKMKLDT